MKTEIYKLDGIHDKEYIARCAEIILNGGLVAFPTETVYGLGANALDDEACKKIYIAKNRPTGKALLCHLYSPSQAEDIAYLNDDERKIISRFLADSVTVIAKKKPCIGNTVSAGGETVGLRFPSNKEAIDFMKACRVPIAATSANISDCPAPIDGETVKQYLDGRIDAILDCGKVGSGVASTIVSLNNGLHIIREGAVSENEIRNALL